MSFDPIPFSLLGGLINWLIVMATVLAIGAVTLTAASLVAGGATGPLVILEQIKLGVVDWLGTSLRRVWAIALLTIRESVRRKALLVFVVFAVLFLFAGWFLSDSKTDMTLQVKVYVSFVLRAISWLILPVVLLLSCWGVPEDIRLRSLHTVVTKPVRRHEIVLGRMLGFIVVGVSVLAVMGVVGYIWIERQIPDPGQMHFERADADHDGSLTESEWARKENKPLLDMFERAQVAMKFPIASAEFVGLYQSAAKATGNIHTYLTSRVPVYGAMTFLDREGNSAREGVNTGDEWMFRSYVEGNTKAAAIWDFEGITPDRQSDKSTLLLESNFQSFRTYKGNIEKGLLCQLTLVNPQSKRRVPLIPFEVQENRQNVYDVARQNPTMKDVDGKPADLFQDLVHDGNLRIEARCLSSQQFLGMARPDLFVRLPDRHFAFGYFKSLIGIGLMMAMIVVLGVMASCFVKGPVAMLMTIFVLIVGRAARPFFEELTGSDWKGGGLIESIYRILIHLNPQVPLESSWPVAIMQFIDGIGLKLMWGLKYVFPDFHYFEMTEYVANGFDVPFAAAILPSFVVAIGYTIPWVLVGYYSLKLRELEAK